jgi:hypothetical protein
LERIQNKVAWAIVMALLLLVLAVLAGVVQGGPLDPPAPPGSTQQNLIFQPSSCTGFPINITSSGGYKLAQNITMPASCTKNGIQIDAPDVTIDLAGFRLAGVAGALSGMAETGTNDHRGLVVTNGTITGWPGGAINTPGVGGGRFQSLHVYGNGRAGTSTGTLRAGTDNVVDNVILSDNSGWGIHMDHTARISNCLIDGFQHGGDGIRSADHASIRNCTVVGFDNGMVLGYDAEVADSTIRFPTTYGIFAADGSTVRDCKVDLANHGILVGSVSTVTGNTITSALNVAIEANGSSQIDSNHIIGTQTGVFLFSNNNTVTRNNMRNVTTPIGEAVPGQDYPPQGPASSLTSPWGNVVN